MSGYPQFSFWILIALAKIFCFHIVIRNSVYLRPDQGCTEHTRSNKRRHHPSPHAYTITLPSFATLILFRLVWSETGMVSFPMCIIDWVLVRVQNSWWDLFGSHFGPGDFLGFASSPKDFYGTVLIHVPIHTSASLEIQSTPPGSLLQNVILVQANTCASSSQQLYWIKILIWGPNLILVSCFQF